MRSLRNFGTRLKDRVKRIKSAPNSLAASPSPSGANSPACASSISVTLGNGRQNIALTTASPTPVDHDHELTSPITIIVHPEPESLHENIPQATASLSDVLSNSNNTQSILPPVPNANDNNSDPATTTATVQTKCFVSQEATVVENNTATPLVDGVTATPGAGPTANESTHIVEQNEAAERTVTTDDQEGALGGDLALQHESNQQVQEIMQASLWEQAWRKLPTETQNHFQFMLDQKDKRLEGLLLEAANARQNCEGEKLTFDDGKKYKRIIVRDILDKLTTWVPKFVAVGDTLVQYDPAHAAIPWAIIRFILQSTIQYKERMGMVATSVEYIGRLVVRCVIYEELYLMGELASSVPYCNNLKVDLESLYQAILSFLVETARYLDRTKLGRILHAILDPEALNGLLQGVQKSEKDIELQIQIIERTLQELRGQVAGDNYRKLKDILDGLEEPLQRVAMGVEGCYEFVNAQKRGGILNWITDNEYGVPHNLALKGLLDNTGKWFFDKEEYKEWRNASASSILWLHGIPGAGKTKLTCQVIKNLQSTHPQEVLCYFYCKRDGEAARRNPLTVVQAVVRQLSLQRPDGIPKSVLDIYDQHEKQGFATGKTSALQWTDCQNLMLPLINTNLQTNIVIDALDELDNESQDRQDLLELLTSLIRECHSLVKIFVSSRDDQDIVMELKNVPNLVIKARENIGDIERFIWREFEINKKFSRPFWSKELKDKVYNELCKKANGMFQWVNLQLQFLGAMKLERDIREKLGRLPKDLTEAYDQLYTLIENEEDHGREVAKGALRWVMCAQEPLTMQMLLEFTSYSAQNEVPDETLLLELCRNLLTWDEEKNMVQFCHLSVQEYLKESKLPDDEAHSILAKSCLLILNSDKPNDEVISQNNTPKYSRLRQYADAHWLEHAKRGCNSKFSNVFLKPLGFFLGNPSKPSGLYINWANSAYIDKYRTKYLNLYGLGSYLFYIRKRENSQSFSLPPNPLFLLVASNFGQGFLDELWPQWQLSCDYQTADTSGMTLLHIAASVGNNIIVLRLLELGASINCLDYILESPIFHAARNRHKEILKLLLEHPDIDVNVQDKDGITALALAVDEGYDECVKLLLAHPAIDVNVQDKDGNTALVFAVYGEYDECMKLLLAHPAIDVNVQYKDGNTALAFAVYKEYDECVKLLLAHPAIDVNMQDKDGDTVLALAISYRNKETAELPLGHSALLLTLTLTSTTRTAKLSCLLRPGEDMRE